MIIIDAGHGGLDFGIVTHHLVEKDCVFKIANYIYNRLNVLGINCALTKDNDESLIPAQRIKKIKELGDIKGNILVSNHFNSSDNRTKVVYALRSNNKLPNLILNELKQNNKNSFPKRLPTDTSKDFYYLMRETNNIEPIIIEYGTKDFLNNWENYAEAVVKALSKYLGFSWQKDNSTHKVTAKDSIYSIALKYNITVSRLRQINGLITDDLKINQVINIPKS